MLFLATAKITTNNAAAADVWSFIDITVQMLKPNNSKSPMTMLMTTLFIRQENKRHKIT